MLVSRGIFTKYDRSLADSSTDTNALDKFLPSIKEVNTLAQRYASHIPVLEQSYTKYFGVKFVSQVEKDFFQKLEDIGIYIEPDEEGDTIISANTVVQKKVDVTIELSSDPYMKTYSVELTPIVFSPENIGRKN